MTDTLIKPADVCNQLSISYNTLLRLLSEQSITGYKVGGQWRFYQADVDAYVQRCRVRASVPMRVKAAAPKRGRPATVGCGYYPGMKVV